MYGFNNISSYERRVSPKKKKRKHSVDGPNISTLNYNANHCPINNNKLSINIIDRVLDLSKYNQETGLYTLCRDWINATTSLNDSATRANSDPAKTKTTQLGKNSTENNQLLSNIENSDDNAYYVTKLPEPEKINEPKIESLNENIKISIRSSERDDLSLIKSLNLNDEIVETHALLKLHVNRWKAVRKEWSKYYTNTNQAFKSSNDVLKSIYEDI